LGNIFCKCVFVETAIGDNVYVTQGEAHLRCNHAHVHAPIAEEETWLFQVLNNGVDDHVAADSFEYRLELSADQTRYQNILIFPQAFVLVENAALESEQIIGDSVEIVLVIDHTLENLVEQIFASLCLEQNLLVIFQQIA
jgi:hypothetical protein